MVCGVGGGGRATTAITAELAPRANREIYVELCIYKYRNAYLHTGLIRVIVVIFSVDERSIIVALSRGNMCRQDGRALTASRRN